MYQEKERGHAFPHGSSILTRIYGVSGLKEDIPRRLAAYLLQERRKLPAQEA
jgi:hypothetical protein